MRNPVTCAAVSPRSSARRNSSRATSCDVGQFAALEVEHGLAVQDRKDLRDVAQVAAQLASPSVGAAGLRSRKSLGGNGGPAECELQAEFALLTLGPMGKALQHLQPFGEVRDRLGHRRARERLLPGLLPVIDCPFSAARPRRSAGRAARVPCPPSRGSTPPAPGRCGHAAPADAS